MSAALEGSERAAEARTGDANKPSRPATDSIADGVRSRPTYAVSLEMFEGPLDLLLHLVRRHELDILDIPIAFITEKYIEYIGFARSLDIEIAGEYLLMAATLAFLKSRELLPTTPGAEDEGEEEEDGVDPREELIRRLIEYERFREAGDELGSRPLFGRDVFPRGGDPDVILPEPGLAPVTLFRLAEAYNRVLDRAKIREDHEVVIEPVTVRQRMTQLSLLFSTSPRIPFESLFLERVWSSERELRQMLVVTLMSVLEMVKLGLIGVHQAQGSDSIDLERTVEVDAMSEAISVFREEGEELEPEPAPPAAMQEAAPQEAEPQQTTPQEATSQEAEPQEAAPEAEPQEAEPQEAEPQEAEPQEAEPQEAEPEIATATEELGGAPQEAEPPEAEPELATATEELGGAPQEAEPPEAEPEAETEPEEAEPQEAEPQEPAPEPVEEVQTAAPEQGETE